MIDIVGVIVTESEADFPSLVIGPVIGCPFFNISPKGALLPV